MNDDIHFEFALRGRCLPESTRPWELPLALGLPVLAKLTNELAVAAGVEVDGWQVVPLP